VTPDVWTGISVRALDWRVGRDRLRWDWLLRALKDLGLGASGWSVPAPHDEWGDASFVFGHPAKAVRDAIVSLWDNERPGCGIEIRVRYEQAVR
jgi:hypothetical protein